MLQLPRGDEEGTLNRVWLGCVIVVLTGALMLVGCSLSDDPKGSPVTGALPSPEAVVTATPTPTPPPSVTPWPTATPYPSPTPAPLEAEVSLPSPAISQGKTGLIRVMTNRPAVISGTLGELPLGFVSQDGLDHFAFLGISAVADIGAQPLTLMVKDDSGSGLVLRTQVQVEPGEFETEYIQFEPEVESLLEPEIAAPEAARVEEVYSRFSPEIRWQGAFRWPLENVYVTSRFGTRRQYGERPGSYHGGLDLRGETGVSVYAAARGRVALAERLQVRGNAVIVDHGAGVLTGYYHLDSIAVEEGQEVEAGDLLGTVGATGLVTAAHLHWELRVGGIPVDPAQWTEEALDGIFTEGS